MGTARGWEVFSPPQGWGFQSLGVRGAQQGDPGLSLGGVSDSCGTATVRLAVPELCSCTAGPEAPFKVLGNKTATANPAGYGRRAELPEEPLPPAEPPAQLCLHFLTRSLGLVLMPGTF